MLRLPGSSAGEDETPKNIAQHLLSTPYRERVKDRLGQRSRGVNRAFPAAGSHTAADVAAGSIAPPPTWDRHIAYRSDRRPPNSPSNDGDTALPRRIIRTRTVHGLDPNAYR